MMTPASVKFIRRLRKITASRSLLKALPTTTCAVCMDDFTCQDKLLRLPNCHHLFHRKCILPWLSRNNTCPLCRQIFPAEQPKRHSVRISEHRVCPRLSSVTDPVFHLNFHLRPLPPSNPGDSPTPCPPMSRLEKILVAEGYHQLVTRACGPFWVSVDRFQQSDAGHELDLHL